MSDAAYAEDLGPPESVALVPARRPRQPKVLEFIGKANIADGLDVDVLAKIGEKVCEEFEVDEQSRHVGGWAKRQETALNLAMQVKEAKNYPWPGASNVKYPLITVAAIQFAARAYPAIVDGVNVVKGKVLGRPTEEKRVRAERIGRHMSYQLLEEMEEWEAETDQLLHILPCTGTVHRKTYFDPLKGRNCSEIVTSDKCVVNYWAKADPLRITQVCEFYPHEILSKQRSGLWRDIDLGQPTNAANDDDAPHVFLEQHRLWDLDGDDYPEPYVVTVHRETRKVVRIAARFEAKGVKTNPRGEIYCIEPMRYFTAYRFMPSLDGSYYGMGFGTLLDALNEVINSTLNQLMDAGHLANVQGGFIGSGVSIKSGNSRHSPGEWKRVESAAASLKDSIVPLPVKEPSSVLFQLLGTLIEAAKDITATKDILTGETGSTNQPVGTTLAQIEQGLKTYSAIIKRVHRGLKAELGALAKLNAVYLQPEVYYTFQDEEGVIAQQDYAQDDVDVVPVSDPSMATDMQKMGRAQFLMQFRPDPLMNGKEINKRVLEAASLTDIEELFAPEPSAPPPEVQAVAKELELKERAAAQKDLEILLAKEQSARGDLELRLKEAEAKAKNANTYATMLHTLSQIGKTTTKGPAGETRTEDTGLSSGDMALMQDLHDLAIAEIGQPDDQSDQIQPAKLPGMEAPSTDPGVPGLPPGSAPSPEGPMGPGPTDGLGPAMQGPPDGGTGEPEL